SSRRGRARRRARRSDWRATTDWQPWGKPAALVSTLRQRTNRSTLLRSPFDHPLCEKFLKSKLYHRAQPPSTNRVTPSSEYLAPRVWLVVRPKLDARISPAPSSVPAPARPRRLMGKRLPTPIAVLTSFNLKPLCAT